MGIRSGDGKQNSNDSEMRGEKSRKEETMGNKPFTTEELKARAFGLISDCDFWGYDEEKSKNVLCYISGICDVTLALAEEIERAGQKL